MRPMEKCVCLICTCGEHRCNNQPGLRHSPPREPGERGRAVTRNTEEVRYKSRNIENAKSRRQWETSPENLQEIYRSLSNVEIAQQKQRAAVRNGADLPPLKVISNRDESLSRDRRMTSKDSQHQSKQDATVSRGVMVTTTGGHRKKAEDSSANRAEDGWVVVKPPRRKPVDLLKLEGTMDLYTTSRSTNDAAAKEIMREMQLKGSNEGDGDSFKRSHGRRDSKRLVNVSGEVQARPQSPPRRGGGNNRRNRARPQTSLQIGGEGDFHTVNQEAFKRFVVVDANNNLRFPAIDRANNGIGPATEHGGKSLSLPLVDNVQLGKRNGSFDSLNRANIIMENGRDSGIGFEMNGDSGRQLDSGNGNGQGDGMQSDLKTNALHARAKRSVNVQDSVERSQQNGESNILYVDFQPRKSLGREEKRSSNFEQSAEAAGQNTMVNQMPEEHRKSLAAKARHSGRVRHQSLPRSRTTKHKNDSQLRFDGDIDFDTTSKVSYHHTTPALGPKETTNGPKSNLRRDLFRTSTEVDLFKRHGDQHFGSETMYHTQFPGKANCPVVDLGTSKSSYRFKAETGGHKFYFPMS